jgi:hypothetical protein
MRYLAISRKRVARLTLRGTVHGRVRTHDQGLDSFATSRVNRDANAGVDCEFNATNITWNLHCLNDFFGHNGRVLLVTDFDE